MKTKSRLFARAAQLPAVFLFFLVTGVLCAAAQAQSHPVKALRIVVPYPAGGGIDFIGRKLAEGMAPALGQQVIVDNRSGANGIIGTEVVARAAPDGGTILLTTVGAHAANPLIHERLPYDSQKDFRPITMVSSNPLLFVAHPSLPVKSIGELVELAKLRPGAISYGSWGVGSMPHLAVEQLKWITGIDLVHVPYKGGPPSLNDTVAGHVQVTLNNVALTQEFIKAGKLRALGVGTRSRLKMLPDVPTVAETAGLQGFEAVSTAAIWAPARTADVVVTRLHSALISAIRMPAFRASLERDGTEVIGNTPEQMAEIVRRTMEEFAEVTRAVAIRPQ